MEYNIKNELIEGFNESSSAEFPKYTSQLINWANQNAQGTRPNVVGQMSELFPDYVVSTPNGDITIETWKDWYTDKYPSAMDVATERIYAQVENLRKAIPLIDKAMVRKWVEDLVINKTFNGMYVQKAILAFLAQKWGKSYRLATPAEEAKGIDGYVGDTAYSVKSDTYKTMNRLSEVIDVKMIYYTKTKTGLKIEVEE